MSVSSILSLVGIVAGLLCPKQPQAARNPNSANARGESKDYYDDGYDKAAKFTKKQHKSRGLCIRKPKIKKKNTIAA